MRRPPTLYLGFIDPRKTKRRRINPLYILGQMISAAVFVSCLFLITSMGYIAIFA